MWPLVGSDPVRVPAGASCSPRASPSLVGPTGRILRSVEREPWRALPTLTEDERRVFELFAQGRRTEEIAAELGISRDTAIELTISVLAKLQRDLTPPDPTPPLAAAAALAVPYQRAQDIPRHVGRVLPRKGSRRSPAH